MARIKAKIRTKLFSVSKYLWNSSIRVIRVQVLCLFVSLVLASSIVFSAECDWVESTGEAVVENITPDEARQTAINRARISAIESKTGVRVHGGTLVKDYNLMADVVQTLSQGYIIDEKIIKWEQGEVPLNKGGEGVVVPLTRYKVRIKACVAGVGEKDPYFKVEGKLNKPVFVAGDEAVITIKTSRDSYLNIFNLTADDRVSLIAPSRTLPIIPIKANKEFKFPPEGFGLLMNVIKDKKRSSECFIIVATKEPYDFIGLSKKAEGMSQPAGSILKIEPAIMTVPEFYRSILKIPSNAKAEEMLVYEVVAK